MYGLFYMNYSLSLSEDCDGEAKKFVTVVIYVEESVNKYNHSHKFLL